MKKSTILLIIEDIEVRTLVSDFLIDSDYLVSAYGDLSNAVEHISERGVPHIALIATELAGLSGYVAADRLKAAADVPIIFLASAEHETIDIVNVIRYGEDFVTGPISLQELGARIQLVLGRTPTLDYAGEPIIRIDDYLSIDFARNRILVAGNTVRLTPKELNLLHVLLRHAPRVIQNETLLSRVWPGEKVYEDTLRVHMHRLRRKIEADSHHPNYVHTERGVGYRFRLRPPGMSKETD